MCSSTISNTRDKPENQQFVGHAKATEGTFRKTANTYFMIEGIKPLMSFLIKCRFCRKDRYVQLSIILVI